MKIFNKITNSYYKTKNGKMPATRYLVRQYWEGKNAIHKEVFTWNGSQWILGGTT
ncbi:hypothetical protein [Ligilactobacillus acidipiscis]|uniref:hypothetical protein n=1 Tax=Ligilactobacillus acidipiscis TaxID=89059 RepID=UPI0023F6B195|nr:hypothetical protein [Ligilactobacillus acidipiscis]WEV56159.1 hypothetical protein OZX66_07840 [Ligilactobacillus acidipiscis]